ALPSLLVRSCLCCCEDGQSVNLRCFCQVCWSGYDHSQEDIAMRSFWVLIGVLAVAGSASADVLNLKFQNAAAVENTVRTDTEHTDYDFFLVGGGKPESVKFGPKQPITFKGTKTGKDRRLVAVPVDARKRYATKEEYERDIGEFRVEGMVR